MRGILDSRVRRCHTSLPHSDIMGDHPNRPEEQKPQDDHTGAPDDASPPAGGPSSNDASAPLDDFLAAQRSLASMDFLAIQAAQRFSLETDALRKIVEAQEAIAKEFSRSFDFTHITEALNALTDTGVTEAIAAQKKWADSLSASIDFPALGRAVAASAKLDEWARTSAVFDESPRKQTEVFAQLAKRITFELPTIDFSELVAALDRWIPVNLRSVGKLDEVATIALDEGLPLSWVPRTEIVALLVGAGDAEERAAILIDRRDDILEDCAIALEPLDGELVEQCRSAIDAIKDGHDNPAQSHASNIIDSIVLDLHGSGGRERTKRFARETLDELPLQLAAENLTLRPLFRAFTTWYPNRGTDPPDHFARHATSHGVGQPGVFAPVSALVAVMLATSLTVQYGFHD